MTLYGFVVDGGEVPSGADHTSFGGPPVEIGEWKAYV